MRRFIKKALILAIVYIFTVYNWEYSFMYLTYLIFGVYILDPSIEPLGECIDK